MKNFLFCVFVFGVFGCDPYDNRLRITNNTNEIVYYVWSKNYEIDKDKKFIYVENGDTSWDINSRVMPNQTIDILQNGYNAWPDIVDKSTIDGKIRIYIFTKKNIKTNGWDKIAKENIYNQKFKFTSRQLDSMNWEIIYR